MANWVNVGARDFHNRADFPTKAALKRAIAENSALVLLYATDEFGPNAWKELFADQTDIGVKYSVVGPNPYTSRKWYATVEKLANGKITVK